MWRVLRRPGAAPEPTLPTAVDAGQWGLRAQLIESNSELALAESNGKLYLLRGEAADGAYGPDLRHRRQQLGARTAAPAAQQPRDGGRRQRKGLHHRRRDLG